MSNLKSTLLASAGAAAMLLAPLAVLPVTSLPAGYAAFAEKGGNGNGNGHKDDSGDASESSESHGNSGNADKHEEKAAAHQEAKAGKTKNLKTDLREELAEPITLHENGARLVISKQRAMIKTALAKALQGDMRAMGVITNLAVKLLEAELAEETNDLTTEDRGILEAYVRRRMAAEARKKKP